MRSDPRARGKPGLRAAAAARLWLAGSPQLLRAQPRPRVTRGRARDAPGPGVCRGRRGAVGLGALVAPACPRARAGARAAEPPRASWRGRTGHCAEAAGDPAPAQQRAAGSSAAPSADRARNKGGCYSSRLSHLQPTEMFPRVGSSGYRELCSTVLRETRGNGLLGLMLQPFLSSCKPHDSCNPSNAPEDILRPNHGPGGNTGAAADLWAV
ncbi:uncharacterized protein LOC122456836 [Dermochelys coriacea]|uniref:uncharacterized protein LOC122456836 n=1 Tax=Dermochelys coriacea TaxID=27794 RepID=UPI001CA88D29|nr:uncharacterized protein LOC122456836 [Dermochelys coriacea]